MIDAAKITAILIFESKKSVGRSKHRNKRRSKDKIYHEYIKMKNTLFQWILPLLENLFTKSLISLGQLHPKG